ncbi:hypothetical protein SNEBB_000576 [Seison nebaliae]|nr:hypothetical protein SNEBB_000576 [Seison nebaliae]
MIIHKTWEELWRSGKRHNLNNFQKLVLGIGSSVGVFRNPYRDDLLNCLSEVTHSGWTERMLLQMLSTTDGQNILKYKPLINSKTINFDKLKKLPENSFGRNYIDFMERNRICCDTRKPVQFETNETLAYLVTRYRQIHDLTHVILDMPTNMIGEGAVKWFESTQYRLPMMILAANFGSIRIQEKSRKVYVDRYVPWSIKMGNQSKPFISIWWEKRFEQPIDELRKEMCIELLRNEL